MLSPERLLVLSAAFLLTAPELRAQGWIEPVRPFPRGAIQKMRSAVQVAVTGRFARVTVEEWFRNTGPVMDEASYLYPLPGETVFSEFSLWQGDRELKGEPMEPAQARAIYEEIVRRERDPALIELAGHGLLRARVFPITPGETRKITLRYTQILERTGDALRFRYAAGTAAAARSFRLQVDSAARVGDPYSPTHRLTVNRSGDRLELALADTTGSGDLELLLPLTRGLVGMSLLTHQPVGEDGFFMLLLAPGRAAAAERLRRDVVAVLDVSGSMSGDKLDQAKAALVQLLGTLRSGDRFRVVTFASGVHRYAAGWTEVSADNIRAAQDWVRRVDTDGGTNIAGALTEALAEPPGEGALGVVVFLTDGMPTVGETDPERIAEQADHGRGAFRVFAFGIGYDVNTYLLDRLTDRARGVTEYIRPGGDIEQAVGSLATKISSPVLTDLALRGDGVELYDLQPERLPDLFAGEELVIFGRHRGGGSGERVVTVTGRRKGAEAVRRSRAEKALVGSAQLSAVTVSDGAEVDASSASRSQRIGGRVFVWRDSTWTDIAHGDSLRVVRVAAFSDAYFALLRALPELRKAATLEPAVLVAGRHVSIKIEAVGRTTWQDGELATLVRDFRS